MLGVHPSSAAERLGPFLSALLELPSKPSKAFIDLRLTSWPLELALVPQREFSM